MEGKARDRPIKWTLPAAACNSSMEQLGEKFGGLETKGVASLGAKATVARTGEVKSLTTPPPPLL